MTIVSRLGTIWIYGAVILAVALLPNNDNNNSGGMTNKKNIAAAADVPLKFYYEGCLEKKFKCISLNANGRPNCIHQTIPYERALAHCRAIFIVDHWKEPLEPPMDPASGFQYESGFNRNTTAELILIGNLLPDEYVAGGLSKDRTMGEDTVGACIRSARSGTHFAQSWNTPIRTNVGGPSEMVANVTENMVSSLQIDSTPDMAASEADLIKDRVTVFCRWNRPKLTEVHGVTFDLSNNTDNIFLLIATGKVNTDDSLTKHTSKTLFNKALDLDVRGRNLYVVIVDGLLRIHIFLITLCWILLVPFAALVAKYYKTDLWGIKMGETDLWFVIHQGSMITAVVANAIAMPLIIIYLYGQDSGRPFKFGGGMILWLISTVHVAFAAFFRPEKESPNRYIFDWAHTIVGHALIFYSFSLGVFASMFIIQYDLLPTFTIVLQFLWFFIFWLVLLICKCSETPGEAGGDGAKEFDLRTLSLNQILLFVYTIGALVLYITFIFLIVRLPTGVY